MSRKYFGTDGIRGTANHPPMTADMALRVGMAAGRVFTRGEHRHRVVIGKDTRLSGYMIEYAMTAGFTSVGMDVFLFGPVPTPAVAMLARSMRADLGVMISASHNAYQDNGIKFFGPDGSKLSDAVELEIEALLHSDASEGLADPANLGRARRVDDAMARYIEFVKRTFPKNLRLEGLRIVLDCANGAAYKVAPLVLWELGAEVVALGVEPNGFNINQDCGSTHPEAMAAKVREVRADLGIALDGDADRVVLVDERGRIIDGDQVMALVAQRWHPSGRLAGGGIVATVMSNLGLERYVNGMGLKLERAAVGDRYVVEHMREHGYQRRRRAVGPHRALRLLDHRRRACLGAASARCSCGIAQARKRGLPSLRAGAAGAALRALPQRRAARSGCREKRDFSGRIEAQWRRASAHPQVGNRARHSRDG